MKPRVNTARNGKRKRTTLPRLPIRKPHLASGFAYQEIIKKAQKDHVDLIIMATYGRTGLGHFLLGSVTEKVVQMAPCPGADRAARRSGAEGDGPSKGEKSQGSALKPLAWLEK